MCSSLFVKPALRFAEIHFFILHLYSVLLKILCLLLHIKEENPCNDVKPKLLNLKVVSWGLQISNLEFFSSVVTAALCYNSAMKCKSDHQKQ